MSENETEFKPDPGTPEPNEAVAADDAATKRAEGQAARAAVLAARRNGGNGRAPSAPPPTPAKAEAPAPAAPVSPAGRRKGPALAEGEDWFHAVENFHLGKRRVFAGEDLLLDVEVARELADLVKAGKAPGERAPDATPDDFRDGEYVVTGETGCLRLSAHSRDHYHEGDVVILTAQQARDIYPGVRPVAK